MSEEAKWYVVHTYSGYENKVASNLATTVENRHLEDWIKDINIRGCTGFVGPNGKPVPLTEEEIASLGVERHEIEIQYRVGDTVKIVDGPLEGFSGKVDEIDREKNKVRVTISMFGRETPVELEPEQAELLD